MIVTQYLMNTIDPNVMLPQVENMLYDLAWRATKTYPVTFEEARSEVYYAFMMACGDFKPDRGAKFSSWCYFWVWTHLKTWITKRTVDPMVPTEINEELVGEAPPTTSPCLDAVGELSTDAQEIISLLVDTPAELLSRQTNTPLRLYHAVKKHLLAQGRSHEEVEKAKAEIEVKFRAIWAT